MSINWDCWIADEDGGTESKIHFRGSDQPKPIPLPERSWQGSIQPLIAAGNAVVQSAGYGPRQLEVNLLLDYPVWESLETLLTRMDDETNEHLQVQFHNSFKTYLCTPVGQLKPVLPNKRPAKVAVTITLLINSEVVPEEE